VWNTNFVTAVVTPEDASSSNTWSPSLNAPLLSDCDMVTGTEAENVFA
jgi:hypothetical protein